MVNWLGFEETSRSIDWWSEAHCWIFSGHWCLEVCAASRYASSRKLQKNM